MRCDAFLCFESALHLHFTKVSQVECRHIADVHQWQTVDIGKFKVRLRAACMRPMSFGTQNTTDAFLRERKCTFHRSVFHLPSTRVSICMRWQDCDDFFPTKKSAFTVGQVLSHSKTPPPQCEDFATQAALNGGCPFNAQLLSDMGHANVLTLWLRCRRFEDVWAKPRMRKCKFFWGKVFFFEYF